MFISSQLTRVMRRLYTVTFIILSFTAAARPRVPYPRGNTHQLALLSEDKHCGSDLLTTWCRSVWGTGKMARHNTIQSTVVKSTHEQHHKHNIHNIQTQTAVLDYSLTLWIFWKLILNGRKTCFWLKNKAYSLCTQTLMWRLEFYIINKKNKYFHIDGSRRCICSNNILFHFKI